MTLTIDGEAFYIDAFTQGYIECALWSSTNNSRDDGGDPLDDNYDIIDLSRETARAMVKDCDDFRDYVCETIDSETADEIDSEQGGHDFWLTRNRHGAGYWDGDWEKGDELTDAAHTFGGVDLYVGDDGKVHS